jgi:hypothetical protein
MLGLDDPIQDALCCGWCGDASDTDICATCQQRYEEDQDDADLA